MSNYPVTVEYRRPERSNRWLALATLLFFVPKALITLPHVFLLYFLGIAALFCGFVAQIVVLFTGQYPKGLHGFITGVMRWQTRTHAFLIGLTDEYPPFRLRP
jgi:hypothetical protein